MLKIERSWYDWVLGSNNELERNLNVLLQRPRIDYRVSEYVFDYINKNILAPHTILQKGDFTIDLFLGPYDDKKWARLFPKLDYDTETTQHSYVMKKKEITLYCNSIEINQNLTPTMYASLVYDAMASFLIEAWKDRKRNVEKIEKTGYAGYYYKVKRYIYPALFEGNNYIGDERAGYKMTKHYMNKMKTGLDYTVIESYAYPALFEDQKYWGDEETEIDEKSPIAEDVYFVINGKFVSDEEVYKNHYKEKRMAETDISNASLLNRLTEEMDMELKGGIYHLTQIKLCYNSNRIEGSTLSEDQTRYIYDTNTVSAEEGTVLNIDDIIETINHFSCFRYLLKTATKRLNETIIKEYHRILKTGTHNSQKDWFNVGDYKKLENMVDGMETTSPENVHKEMNKLLENYHQKEAHTINDIITFHHDFESIHPFQNGNGQVGRLILFKECLKNNIVPFIINEDDKLYYYRGLKEYTKTPGHLIDTCLSAQDLYKGYLNYYKITFTENANIEN